VLGNGTKKKQRRYLATPSIETIQLTLCPLTKAKREAERLAKMSAEQVARENEATFKR
jgi:hypothetical protein